MKIEQNLHKLKTSAEAIPVANKQNPPNKQEVDKTDKTKANAQAMQKKMLHWFTQAGIKPSADLNLQQETDKKINRRRYVNAQRKLDNLESILSKALDFCLESGVPDEIDPDWFFSFVNLAEEIYSPMMQDLWGKIFAVEVGRPGSFSLRTLSTLKQLTQKDAHIFKSAVNLASRKKGGHAPMLIYGYYQKPSLFNFFSLQKSHQLNLAEFGLSYPDILALMDMGLIFSSEIESAEMDPNLNSQWRCGQQLLHLSPRRNGIALTYYKFTTTGTELARLVQGQPHPLYLDKLKQCLAGGFEVT